VLRAKRNRRQCTSDVSCGATESNNRQISGDRIASTSWRNDDTEKAAFKRSDTRATGRRDLLIVDGVGRPTCQCELSAALRSVKYVGGRWAE
jgi:hypothetical protein